MSNNAGKNPLEEQFRSSQIYKTLQGTGVNVADKIASSIGKVADEINHSINNVNQNVQQNIPQQPVQPTQPRQQCVNGVRTSDGASGAGKTNGYSYNYNYNSTDHNGNGANDQNNNFGRGRPNVNSSRTAWGNTVNRVSPPTQPQMKMEREKSNAKFYITGVAALIYALFAPLYAPAHFVVFGLVMAGVFFLSSKLFKGKKKFVPVEPEKPKPQPTANTGNSEVDSIISEGSVYLKKLHAANDSIPDENLSSSIERMEYASFDIFRFISDHPEKAPQIRKFMNYYLPTTLKLLNSYQTLSMQSAKGENITSTMHDIEGMMQTVAVAFEKQLDSLFSDEAMDISTDITVFENILEQEGFINKNGMPTEKEEK